MTRKQELFSWVSIMAGILAILFSGCSGLQTTDQTTEVLVRMAAVEVGCQVAKDGNADLDRALRNVYEFAKTGEIPEDALMQLATELAVVYEDRPTLGLQLANLASLIGVQIEPGGIVGIETIPPEILKAVAGGYDSGFGVCFE